MLEPLQSYWPVGLGHFSLLLAEFAPQGGDLLLKQPDPLWLDALGAHLGGSQLLDLSLQLWKIERPTYTKQSDKHELLNKSGKNVLNTRLIHWLWTYSDFSREMTECHLLKTIYRATLTWFTIYGVALTFSIARWQLMWEKSTARAPLTAKNVKQQHNHQMKNNTCKTVSCHVHLTVHKYGLEARLGPGLNWTGWWISWWWIDRQTGGVCVGDGERRRSRARHSDIKRNLQNTKCVTQRSQDKDWREQRLLHLQSPVLLNLKKKKK